MSQPLDHLRGNDGLQQRVPLVVADDSRFGEGWHDIGTSATLTGLEPGGHSVVQIDYDAHVFAESDRFIDLSLEVGTVGRTLAASIQEHLVERGTRTCRALAQIQARRLTVPRRRGRASAAAQQQRAEASGP